MFAQNLIRNAQHNMKKLHYTLTCHKTRFCTSTWLQQSLVSNCCQVATHRLPHVASFDAHILTFPFFLVKNFNDAFFSSLKSSNLPLLSLLLEV